LRPDVVREGRWFHCNESHGQRFCLDTFNQCIWKHVPNALYSRITLPPKTFAVLKHLIDRAGQLVTQEEFLEIVWPGVYVQPEVLKSQILSIRSALEDDARNPRFIETLSRRGYRFIAQVSTEDAMPAGVQTAASASTALVGRDRPLSELRASLQRTVGQRQREMVFVTGETGIGKTSVVDALLRQMRLEMPQARFARGQCIEGYGGREPYYPMLEALGELGLNPGGEQLLRELAACAPSWLAQIPALLQPAQRPTLERELLGGTRERMPRELLNLFERVTHDSPVVLVFEDLQWADPATVSLIEVLARTRTPMQLMLIGTYRAGDLMSGDHALSALRQELQLHGLCEELPLQPLTQSEIAAYLTAQASGGASPPDGLAELIYRRTEGNPLFMVTLLEHLCQHGLLSNLKGAWQLRAPLHTIEFEVPESLREVIDARVARLSAEEQCVLEAASIVGLEFCAQWCADAAGLDPERVEALCQALAERHSVLRPSQSNLVGSPRNAAPRYEFAHAMYREVLYRRLTPSRRAGLHLRVARSLEAASRAGQPQLAPVLAHHLERGSRPAEAARYRNSAHDFGRDLVPYLSAGHYNPLRQVEPASLREPGLLSRGLSRVHEGHTWPEDADPLWVRPLVAG
jgi:DNA-binding winged helix-turn-helix (wHTH) protein